MPRSQNATFRGAEPEPDRSRIRGESIARLLASQLPSRGWTVGALDDWRDSGFLVPVCRDGESLQLVIIPYHGDVNRWIMQIAAARYPILTRWLGSQPSATSDTIYALAIDSHHLLADSSFTDLRWCWDDLADTDECNCEPQPVSAN